MKCKDCNYCWQGVDDDFPCCHYLDDGSLAPCEWDDEEEVEDRYTLEDLGWNWY